MTEPAATAADASPRSAGTSALAEVPPDVAVGALASQSAPFLIGVRHHSPALAVVTAELLTDFAPDVLAVELPAEAQGWLGWLSDPAAVAPLALAFGTEAGQSFYPFADFSPELAALRWARTHGVPVRCIDLPIAARPASGPEGERLASDGDRSYREALASSARSGDPHEVWDRMIEAPAPGSSAEALRRAALAHGWASRRAEPTPDPYTLAREAQMRACISAELAAGLKVAAVVGAFHVPALTEDQIVANQKPLPVGEVPTALVRYSFAELDSRSGYPAGIRDPGWQQAVLEAAGDPAKLRAAATGLVTRVSRTLRSNGHPCGPAETAEALRVANDLAAIRYLPAPGRREVIEAATSVLAQGEVLGRGRAVAAALSEVLIGKRYGRVAPGTPISALQGQLRAELVELRLPVEGERDITLAPLRGGLDLSRYVLFRRLQVAAISYARPVAREAVRGAERVTQTWQIAWTPATEASIELASVGGLDASQVARTRLLTREVAPEQVDQLLLDAADCAVPEAVRRAIDLLRPQVATAGFAAAVASAVLLADLASARIPGAQLLPAELISEANSLADQFDTAVVREIAGIAGSEQLSDVSALASYVSQGSDQQLSISHALSDLLRHGSPMMQGAVVGLGLDAEHAELVASWLQQPDQRALRLRLAGLIVAAGASIETSPGMAALLERVNTMPTAGFVGILPALRGGFDPMPSEAKASLLEELARRYGPAADLVLSPQESAAAAAYDAAAAERLRQLGLADVEFSPAERWRLVLGAAPGELSAAGARMASALDELYGSAASDSLDEGRRGAGRGPAQLGARAWRDEIEVLFGAGAVTEIFGEAAARGRGDVLSELNPETVRPSIELLTTALSLTGALPESRLAQLRPLVARLVKELTAELAIRIRPALSGLATPKPTRRRTARLDLPRTIKANLKNVVAGPQIVPAQPVFKQLGNKQVDWELIIVVDVSGSMSQSVVFSALTAAVLAGVPSLKVSFLTFSTTVIDFSDRVADPLTLLLEVSIGGGTDIASAMRAARAKVRVPSRTLCAVVSDFEEAGSTAPLLAEVEAMATSGVKLLGCAALDDRGAAVYNAGIASQVAAAGMRVAAVSPLELAQWVRQVVRG